MRKISVLLFIIACLSIIRTNAQIPVYQNLIFVSSAPSGPCSLGSPVQVVISTGILYSCQSGTWALSSIGFVATASVTQPPYNASGFIAKTTLTSTAAIGATSFSVASTAGFYPGDVVIIALGGTGGTKDYAGFIATASGTTLTINNTAVAGNLLPPTATSGTAGLTTQAEIGYQVYSVGTTTTSTLAASGATAVALTNASSYLQGQGALLFGCGASGANQLVTISAVTGNVLTITPGIANASGCASGSAVQHDDTAAFQAAVNLVTSQQNTKVFLPDGFYQINPPTLTASNNAIDIPCIEYYSTDLSLWAPQSTLEITGMTAAPQTQSYLATKVMPSLAGAIIKTSLSNGFADWLLGPATCSASVDGFTNVQLILENLTFRSYPTPAISVVNAKTVESLKAYNLNFDTGSTGASSDPTGGYGAALYGPYGANGSNNVIYNIQAIGYWNGIVAGEHTRVEHARLDNCEQPLDIGTQSSVSYGFTGVDIACDGSPHCITALSSPGTVMNLDISLLNIEHQSSPSWVSAIDDISDPANVLHGRISLDVAEPFTPTVSGGSGLSVFDAHFSGSGITPAMTAGSITVNTTSACSPGAFCVYYLTNCGTGGALSTDGALSIGTVTAGASFVINSSSATDTSKVCWRIN